MHFVTGYKGPVVYAYHELRELAAANGVRFLFEATVMGGAPIFSLFREALPAARLMRFRGILNSTTNLILTEMEHGNSLSLARPNKMLLAGALFADEATRRWHRSHQFPLLAWSSLAGGFMSGKFKPDDHSDENMRQVYYSDANFERLRRAQELAARKNVTIPQIGLAYVLQQAFRVIALVGPSTVNNLNGSLGALNVELTLEEMQFLDLTTQ